MKSLNKLKIIAGIVLILIICSFKTANNKIQINHKKIEPPFLSDHSAWVDSVFNSLRPDEKIAQLFMVAAYSNKGIEHKEEIARLIKKYKIGGLIFFQGGPVRQANLTNYYQSISETPLMIAMDAEWGLGMRLDSTVSFPRQMTLGAIEDNKLIYEMGAEIAKQLKRLGVHINFAPVVDINNNPKNPVINSRSFGEDKENVSRKGFAYMAGLQDNRVLATAKHFPGHGDTDSDSHETLPTISHSKERLNAVEFYPFKQLIKSGLGGVMVAHLNIPSLDTIKNLPSTLSEKVVDGLLKKELGFDGLIFTDALNMKGVTNHFEPGEIEVKALIAGNDVLLYPENIPKAIRKIKRAVKNKEISWDEINKRCRKVLAAKRWFGLDKYKPIETNGLVEELNSVNSDLINRHLIESSLTLVKNDEKLLPIKSLDTLNIATVTIASVKSFTFQKTLGLYAKSEDFFISKNASVEEYNKLINDLSKYNLVIVGILSSDRRPSKKFGISENSIKFVEKLSSEKNVILDLFANPYALDYLKNHKKIKSIIVSYENSKLFKNISAQLIFGGIPALGRLPVSANNDFAVGSGIINYEKIRNKYSIPEEVNISSTKLAKIDSIVFEAIENKATPGCQILISRQGTVIYNKSFGYFTYAKKHKVLNSDIYDLASITKIAATLPSLMKLYEQGKFDINESISKYLPFLDTTNKKDLLITDILTHQAQLTPWIPFYTETIENEKLYKQIYSKIKTKNFSVQVAENLYITESYKDSIYLKIAQSELWDKKEYKYSDLGFYLFYKIIEDITTQKLDEYVDSEFYKPLGANSLTYNPLRKFDRNKIAPTENDKVFRNQIIKGFVHDPGAAMLGGVCGHAGLFSNANDIAKLMQMYLNNGTYGGVKYFENETIALFTKCMFCKEGNRRALGFDKPEMDFSKDGPTFQGVSAESFGHSGFTGTLVWADPEKQIVYVFLSNRIYPDADNRELIITNVRTRIQEAIYDAIY